jgi:hypothetical protein
MCPGGLIVLTTIGSCLYSFFTKIKEFLGMSISTKTTANNDNINDNINDNQIFTDIDDENHNQNYNNVNNTNNIEVNPIINIKLDEIEMPERTTENDIIKELIKLEGKKVETIRRMYSLQAKIYECPKCKTKIILQENENQEIQFAYPDSLVPTGYLEPSKSVSFIKKNFFNNKKNK